MSIQRVATPLALTSWCLIAALPFLSRLHYVPLPQWFGEAVVVWLALAAWLFLLPGGALPARLPRVSVWMLGLAAVWAVQPWFVDILFPGMNWATSLCFVALALLGYVTVALRERRGSVSVTAWLAWGLLFGALAQSLIGFCQVTGLAVKMGGVLFYDSSHPTTNVFGHIGQRNQYAHYLAWGALATAYLACERRLKIWLATLIVLWLALSMGWAASRTVLLYAVAMVVIGWLWHWRVRETASRRLGLAFTGVAVAILAGQFLVPLANHLMSLFTHSHVEVASGVERLAANSDDMGARRFVEWHKAWIVFQAQPWFGTGWSQFGTQSVLLQMRPEFADAAFNSGLFTNAHNLVLQLMAEVGVVGTLASLGGFVWAIWPYFGRKARPEGALPLAMLAVTMLHSMLEYPLWYLYFLAVLVIAVALAPQPEGELRRGWLVPLISAVMAVALTVLAVQGYQRYWELVGLYTPFDNAKRDAPRVARLAAIVEHEPLYAFHALNTLDNYLDATPDNLVQKRRWVNLLAASRPYPDVLLKKAKLEALAGEERRAEETLSQALASFPTYAQSFLDDLPEDQPQYNGLRRVAQVGYDRLPARYKKVSDGDDE
ncbi:Wzy polymerase domain-containing protein [Crenobacter sp. SG2303]|uniref:Wzy polymerase domain-containing protein n=1 Tax=Crenobacter oryzisoli TaxID=3056844 RepID=A0ABT7XPI9_9NEIS|nr:Wzy polymerase domain-containing protein [Crenobacter sp. SG2303]MDN0075707.1 Wzy polymerase domain-containing protein [Crenobacter sp. SG2303]